MLQASADIIERTVVTKLPDITLKELLVVFQEALATLRRCSRTITCAASRCRCASACRTCSCSLQTERYVDFIRLFDPTEGRMGVTVTFLAVLELMKEHLIDVVQAEAFGPIHVCAAQYRLRSPWPSEKSRQPQNSGTDEQSMDETEIKYVVEAALLAAGRPLTLERLGELFTGKGGGADRATLKRVLDALAADYEGRGIEVERSVERLSHASEALGERLAQPLWEEQAPRYTRALLETLALVAYRQPITRAEIEEVRGVVVSTNIIAHAARAQLDSGGRPSRRAG